MFRNKKTLDKFNKKRVYTFLKLFFCVFVQCARCFYKPEKTSDTKEDFDIKSRFTYPKQFTKI